jgi:hypothetical protein
LPATPPSGSRVERFSPAAQRSRPVERDGEAGGDEEHGDHAQEQRVGHGDGEVSEGFAHAVLQGMLDPPTDPGAGQQRRMHEIEAEQHLAKPAIGFSAIHAHALDEADQDQRDHEGPGKDQPAAQGPAEEARRRPRQQQPQRAGNRHESEKEHEE